MSDLEETKSLLKKLGVEFSIDLDQDDGCQSITCRTGGKKVSGYYGFFTEFEFDRDGKFVRIGAWE